MQDTLSSNDARLLVMEMSIAALIAQLPPASLEEVVSMLAFVSGTSEEAEDAANLIGERQLGYVSHWSNQMIDRVMSSRKLSRPTDLSPEEAQSLRYVSRPSTTPS